MRLSTTIYTDIRRYIPVRVGLHATLTCAWAQHIYMPIYADIYRCASGHMRRLHALEHNIYIHRYTPIYTGALWVTCDAYACAWAPFFIVYFFGVIFFLSLPTELCAFGLMGARRVSPPNGVCVCVCVCVCIACICMQVLYMRTELCAFGLMGLLYRCLYIAYIYVPSGVMLTSA